MKLRQTEQTLIDRYSLNVTVDNVYLGGLIVPDENGKLIKVADCVQKEGYLLTETSQTADILVLAISGILSGWCNLSDTKAQDEYTLIPLANIKSLPDSFAFTEPCGHLTRFGGIWELNHWECLGCGAEIVYG